jgi:hypothetical protein
MRTAALICILGLAGVTTVPARAGNPGNAPVPAPAVSPAINAQNTNPAMIDLPVPVGEPVQGIKIPQYDENGKLTMNLSAETARKLDDTHVDLRGLKVVFSDKEEKEISVEIPHSVLDLGTKVLSADSRTVITREDFDIIGSSATFDTSSRSGSFKGHVQASFRNDTDVPVSRP